VEKFSTEAVVMMVCSAAIGTLFAGCSAALGWLISRASNKLDALGQSHGALSEKHAVVSERVDRHSEWLKDHELQLNNLRSSAG
jgi:hypothetical protein